MVEPARPTPMSKGTSARLCARTDGMRQLATLAASADLQMRKLPCRTVAAQRPRFISSVVCPSSEDWVPEGGSYLRGRLG